MAGLQKPKDGLEPPDVTGAEDSDGRRPDAGRILFIAPPLDPLHGGPSESVLSAALLTGAAVTIMTFVPADRVADVEAFIGRRLNEGVESTAHLDQAPLVEVVPVSNRWPAARNWGLTVRRMPQIVRNVRTADAVHLHSVYFLPAIVASVVARMLGRPLVVSPHEQLTDYDIAKNGPANRAAKRAIGWAVRRLASAVVFSSHQERRRSGPCRSIVLGHPLALGIYGPEQRLRPPEVCTRLGTLSRFDPKKRVPDAVRWADDANGKVGSSWYDLTVAGSGDPSIADDIRTAADAAANDTEVDMVGFIEASAKLDFLHSIDVLLIPSEFECFGVAAVEALAAGVLVVATPDCGFLDFLDEEAGAFRASSSDDAGTVLARLARGELDVASMRVRASKTVKELFDGTDYQRRILEAYDLPAAPQSP